MKRAILINNTESENHHGCYTVINQIKKLLKKKSIKLVYSHDTNLGFENYLSLIKKRDIKFDLLIINGEGSLHSSSKKAKEIIEIGYWTKKVLNKSVILINSVFQNNDQILISKIKSFDLIYVRDKFSQKYLSNNNIECNYVPDLVFSYNKRVKSINSKKIVFTDSVFRNLSHDLFNLQKSFKNTQFIPLSTRPSIFFFKAYTRFIVRYYILKIPFIFKKYKNIDYEIQKKYLNYYSFINEISNAKINICARYHAIVFSLIFRVPFVAIKSNTHKVESLLNEIGLENRLIKIEELKFNNIIKFSSYSNQEIDLIENFIKKSKIKIKDMFTEIKKV